MKILVFSFYHPPDLSAGSFRIKSLLQELQKHSNKITVDVITTYPNRYSSFKTHIKHEDFEEAFNIHRINVPNHKSGMLSQAISFIYFAFEAIKISRNIQSDVVFATSSRLMTATLAAYTAKQKKADLILDIRDLFLDTIKEILNPILSMLIYPILKRVEFFTFNKAKKINVVSDGFRAYIKNINPDAKITCYTNGIDKEFLNLENNHKNLVLEKNIKTILYVGNIGDGQGLDKIIPDIAKQISNQFKFLIIGDGGKLNKLKKEISLKNIKNVNFIKPMPRLELLKHYNDADILFLHLNEYKCFRKVLPSKIFEYATFNKPIIAGVDGYAKDFINSEINWAVTFPPCNSKECIKAIKNNLVDTSTIDNADFKRKYNRENIMKTFVDDIFFN